MFLLARIFHAHTFKVLPYICCGVAPFTRKWTMAIFPMPIILSKRIFHYLANIKFCREYTNTPVIINKAHKHSERANRKKYERNGQKRHKTKHDSVWSASIAIRIHVLSIVAHCTVVDATAGCCHLLCRRFSFFIRLIRFVCWLSIRLTHNLVSATLQLDTVCSLILLHTFRAYRVVNVNGLNHRMNAVAHNQ